MDSIPRKSGSGSQEDHQFAGIDDRKRKRMLSNRESARRSRMKKQKQLDDLTNEISRLQISNVQLAETIKAKEEAFIEMESTTNVLKAHAMELADRLRSLNSILEIAVDVCGLSIDIPEIPDPLLKPWQLPYAIQPIMASADMTMH
ncbi:BZIP transcription factor [Quillaja saponaria]|uniref:BZIP transcription factor n=1 Tax=Quillaja saponaria TaxID=32244 RepID=A0AAD7QB33_QUISA|nr:BZIP transcription factor [Quillaja saponaria]